MQCPTCKAENPPAAERCSSCGAVLAAPAAERKLVTALYADLVGHTAIQTRIDPEEWWRFLQAYFAEIVQPIQRYGGTVEKFIGDAVFAVFGVPQAHEDDAERAVRAALEMQEVLERLNVHYAPRFGASLGLRIGLSTGEAIAPRTTGKDQLVTGELTNLAERLQSQARPGSITLSERTYRLVEPLVEAEPVGPLALKGFPGTHPAYVVRRLRIPVRPMRGLGLIAPLVDREREMETLHEAGRRLGAGQGLVVCVLGEAGLGKSRLVSEFLASLRPEATVLEARGHEFTQDDAYGIVVQHLRAYVQLEDAGTLQQQQARLLDSLQRLRTQPSPEMREALAHLLGLDVAHEFENRTRGLDPDEVRRHVVRAVAALWEAAERHPLVLVAEDLHWMDSASAAVLEELVRVTDRIALLLLCVFRPERQSLAWEFKFKAERDYPHRYREIRLEPLSMGDTEELAQFHLEQLGLAAVDLKKTVAARSEGNPLYVEEVVRSLKEYGEPAPARLPETLQGILQARLDALPEPTRHLLQTAAVIGRTFPLRLLQAAVGQEVDLGSHLSALQRGEFVVEQQFVSERQFAFKHVLLQEAAHGRLLREDRKNLHRRLAEIIARETAVGATLPLLFHHFEAGEVWDKAVEYGEQAAAWAREVGATDQALAHYQRLIMILESHPTAAAAEAQVRIREPYGDLLVLVGRFEEGRTQYAMVQQHAQTASQRAHAQRLIAGAYRLEGKLDSAIEHLREALLLLPPGADPTEEAWAHLDMGYVEDLLGSDPNSVLAHGEKAKLLVAGRDPVLTARVFRLFTIAHAHLEHITEAMRCATEAVAWASKAGDLTELAVAHNNLADVYRHEGEIAKALEQVRLGLAAATRAEQRKAVYQIAVLHITMGELHLDRGEWEEARRVLEEGLQRLEEVGPRPRLRVELLADLTEALAQQGKHAEALHLLDESDRLCAVYPLRRFVPKLLRIRGEVYLQAGDLARADEACEQGLEAIGRYGSAVERPGLLRVRGSVARSRGELDVSLTWLKEAASLLGATGQTPEIGRTHLEIGKTYLMRHDRTAAVEALNRSRDVFTHLEAHRLVDEVDRLLAEADSTGGGER